LDRRRNISFCALSVQSLPEQPHRIQLDLSHRRSPAADGIEAGRVMATGFDRDCGVYSGVCMRRPKG
jgi:hypothetical protein